MGCWFACLRSGDALQSPPVFVSSTPSKSRGRHSAPISLRDRLAAAKQLDSVVVPEGKVGGGMPARFVQLCIQTCQSGLAVVVCPPTNFFVWPKEKRCPFVVNQGSVDTELKCEAKFLRYCGALLQFPTELTKASLRKTIQQSIQLDDAPASSHFLLCARYCKKFQWDEQPEEPSFYTSSQPNWRFADSIPTLTPPKKQQIVRTRNDILHSGTPISSSIVGTGTGATPNPSLRFEEVQRPSAVELDMDAEWVETPQNGGSSPAHRLMHSPYTTPLKLTDEMETPCTSYPVKEEENRFGNEFRIRSQYIYPVFNHTGNPSHSQLKGEVIPQCLGHSSGPIEQVVQDANSPHGKLKPQSYFSRVNSAFPRSMGSVTPTLEDAADRESTDHRPGSRSPAPEAPSFSLWREPAEQGSGRVQCKDVVGRQYPISRSTERNRPIIGTVAANWNNERCPGAFPNKWAENGIPNFTNKYKEDQRVSWHATPFEERLEKALSK